MRTVPIAVWRLMLACALMMSGMSVIVLIAGIIGVRFAPFESLATLPIACVIVGLAAPPERSGCGPGTGRIEMKGDFRPTGRSFRYGFKLQWPG